MGTVVSSDPREILKGLAKENALWIDRVPKKTKSKFKQLAFDEFEGDYGMLLKMLLDNYEGTVLLPDAQMKAWMEGIENRLNAVEAKPEQPEENLIHMGSGRKIRKRGE